MKEKRTDARICPWCGRRGTLTKKGALAPHLTMGGMRCMSAVQIAPDQRTPPKRMKGTTQRNPGAIWK